MGLKQLKVHAQAQLPVLIMGYNVPTVTTAQEPWEPYALELIAHLLDAGDSARLSKHLIRDKHIAAGVQASYDLYTRYTTQFVLYGVPNQNHQLQEVRKALLAELTSLQQQPVSPQNYNGLKIKL